MFGSTVALLTRSLRVDARLFRHHVLRLLFVLIVYISLIWAQLASEFFGAPGLQLFQLMAWMNVVFVTLAGLGFFASAITEEKEEDTLGLLKMAGVRPLSLLLGKSTSRLLTAGLLLSMQFPFTLLAITLGGVSIDQVLAVYLSLLAYIALVANLALFWSVVSNRTSGAATGVFLGLLIFFVIPPLVREWCQSTNMGSASSWEITLVEFFLQISEWLVSASVATQMYDILQTKFSFPTKLNDSRFGVQVISNFAAAFGLFVLSWLVFERCTRSLSTAAPGRRVLLHRLSNFRIFSAGRAWSIPLIWKDFHFVAGGFTMAAVKFVFYGLLVVLFAYLQQRWYSRIDVEDLGDATMIAMLIAGAVELSLLSGRIFQTELQWHTWPTLRMLPKSLPVLVYTKVAGCLFTLGPAVVYMGLGAMMDPDEFIYFLREEFTEWGFWVGVFVFGFFLHLTALLSLYVKWGALPLAIGMMFFGYVLFGMSFGLIVMLMPSAMWMGDGTVIVALFAIFFLGLNVGMEILIGLRLRQLAER
jgi:hypothetical protein